MLLKSSKSAVQSAAPPKSFSLTYSAFLLAITASSKPTHWFLTVACGPRVFPAGYFLHRMLLILLQIS